MRANLRWTRGLSGLLFFGLMLVLFQNCNKSGFKTGEQVLDNSDQLASVEDVVPEPEVPFMPPPPPGPIPPASAGVPSWVSQLPLWHWYEIPNTALSSVDPLPKPIGGYKAKIDAWCGATLKREGSVYLIGAAGGHADYVGNEVDALRLNSETPHWEQLRGPTPNDQIVSSVSFYNDLRPAARHTYYSTQFIEASNHMIVFRGGGISSINYPQPAPDSPYLSNRWHPAFSLSKGDWEPPEYISRIPSDGHAVANLVVKHPVTEDVYFSWKASNPTPGAESVGNPGGWWVWRQKSNTWEKLSGTSINYAGAAIDPKRNRLLHVGGYNTNPPAVRNLDGTEIKVTFGGLGASAITDATNTYPGVHYDEALDKFVIVRNVGEIIKVLTVDAETFKVEDPGLSGIPPARRVNGIQNSAQYVPELKGFVIATKHSGNVYFVRTSP